MSMDFNDNELIKMIKDKELFDFSNNELIKMMKDKELFEKAGEKWRAKFFKDYDESKRIFQLPYDMNNIPSIRYDGSCRFDTMTAPVPELDIDISAVIDKIITANVTKTPMDIITETVVKHDIKVSITWDEFEKHWRIYFGRKNHHMWKIITAEQLSMTAAPFEILLLNELNLFMKQLGFEEWELL